MEKKKILEALIRKWDRLNDLLNPYQFGFEEVDLEGFLSVLKESYQAIRRLRLDFVLGKNQAEDVFYYAELISVISRYIPDTCMDCTDPAFLLTCSLADALRFLAVYPDPYPEEKCALEGTELPAHWQATGQDQLCSIGEDAFLFSFNFNGEDYAAALAPVLAELKERFAGE